MEKRKAIPKKAFDMEYSTDWLREVDFLKGRGIFPTYQKTNKFGITTYKYQKSPELFLGLMRYYTILEYEQAMAAAKKADNEKKPESKPEKKDERPRSSQKIDGKEVAPVVGADRFKGFVHTTPAVIPSDMPVIIPNQVPGNMPPFPDGAVLVPVGMIKAGPQVTMKDNDTAKDNINNIVPFKTEDDTE